MALNPQASSIIEMESGYLEHMLTNGMMLVKYPKKPTSQPEERLVKVELYPLFFVYESKSKRKEIEFSNIVEIRMGQNTKGFEIVGKQPALEEKAFSVIYMHNGKYKELNFLAPSIDKCNQWVIGLHMLLTEQSQKVHDIVGLPNWLRDMWNKFDANCFGSLDLNSVTSLMQRLNIGLSTREIKSAVKQYRLVGNQINFEQFEKYTND